jgi:hypothetical protein
MAPLAGNLGRGLAFPRWWHTGGENTAVHNIFWLIGVVVVILAILGFLGLR